MRWIRNPGLVPPTPLDALAPHLYDRFALLHALRTGQAFDDSLIDRGTVATVLSSAPTSGTAAVRSADVAASPDELDREASLILSAMEAAVDGCLPRLSPMERRLRGTGRMHFRTRAELRLCADGPTPEPWLLYGRDIDTRAMGFVSPDTLPLGHRGRLRFQGPRHRQVTVDVTLTRCRACSGGWYEGSLHFHRPQGALVEDLIDWLIQHPGMN